MRGRQPHRHSGELLREVVSAVVPEEECERYLVFAGELYATLHHRPQPTSCKLQATKVVIPTEPGEWRNLAAQDRGRDPSTPVGVTDAGRRGAQFPDFSHRTKIVVMKWFRRGLSGHLMWRIGERLMGWPDQLPPGRHPTG